MSTGTENTIKGKLNEVAGKAKQSFGEATHNQKIANEGAAQQVKGHAEQAWGSVKAAASETASEQRARHQNDGDHTAHDVRQSITSTAQNVKEQIQQSISNYRADHKK